MTGPAMTLGELPLATLDAGAAPELGPAPELAG